MRDFLLWCTVYDNYCDKGNEEYPEECNYCMSGKCETRCKTYYKKIKEEEVE